MVEIHTVSTGLKDVFDDTLNKMLNNGWRIVNCGCAAPQNSLVWWAMLQREVYKEV